MPVPGGVAVEGRPRERHTVRRVCVAAFLALAVVASFALPASAAKPTDPPAAEPPAAEQPAPADETSTEATDVATNIEAVIAAARSHLGVPYRVGSEGPNLFDCSGLMYRIFEETGQLERIGGARLRAAGYMRWFMSRGRAVASEELAARGDLVIYNHGTHIGIYLGEGRVLSAITSGVSVHSLRGITVPVTAFLKVDWSGDGGPLADPSLFDDLPERPVSLVATPNWVPTPDGESTVNRPGRARDEREDMRTATTRTYENPDGTFTTEFHSRPIHYLAPDATEWQPIDLTFKPATDGAGASVTDSPVGLSVGQASTAAAFVTATAGEQQVGVRLAESGRSRTPASPIVSIDGRYADYFDLYGTGIGMRVFPRADGFKGFLVLRNKPRVNRFSFAIEAPGLTPAVEADGSISLRDAAGALVGRLPRPLLLDSSDVDGSGGGVFTAATSFSLDVSGELPVVTISIERSYLEQAVFPAFVDLSLAEFPAAAGAELTFASSRHPNANFDRYQRPEGAGYAELWHGRSPSSRSDNEIYVRFPGIAETLGTVDVASAALELFPYWQRAEEAAPTVVRRVTTDWDAAAVTWNARPAAGDELISTTSDAGVWSDVDVSAYVAELMAGATDYGLVLAGDDSGAVTWKRFVAEGQFGEDDLGPRLSVNWSGLRPSAVAPAGSTVLAPTLSWSHAAIAPAQSRFQVEISRDGFATSVVSSGTMKGRRGTATQWASPTKSLTQGATYSWRVRVKYEGSKTWSAWSTPQTFTYAAPKVEADPF